MLRSKTESRSMEQQTLFIGGRFPNVIIGLDSTVVVSWGMEQLATRRSIDGGAIGHAPIQVQTSAIHGGGALESEADRAMRIFAHYKHPNRLAGLAHGEIFDSSRNKNFHEGQPMKAEHRKSGSICLPAILDARQHD